MTKTYEKQTDEFDKELVIESETKTVTTKRTYEKQWLIDEITRLQAILSEFEK